MNLQNGAIIRRAQVTDVPVIASIVNKHAQLGVMLSRPISKIYEFVRDYFVVEINGEVAGCGALHVIWADLAEIRAVALLQEYIGRGYGRHIVEALLAEASELGLKKVFTLTYNEDFFKHMGFCVIDKSELPHKIWSECVNCIHFPNCNEVAMIKNLE